MQNINFCYLDIQQNEKGPLSEVQLLLYQEDHKLEFSLIYESKIFEPATNGKSKLLMHEGINFHLQRKELFLKLIIRYRINNDEKGCFREKNSYYFYEDLLRKKKGLKVKLDNSNWVRVVYDTQDPQPVMIFQKTKDREQENPEVENLDLLELIKINKFFMQKITPIRKFSNEVEAFVLKESMTRDVKIYMWLVVYFYFGCYLLAIVACFLVITDLRFKVRQGFTNWGRRFFLPEPASVEAKSNLQFIKNQQLALINMSTGLRKLVYSRNRRVVFGISTYSVPVILTVAAIHCFDMKEFMSGILLYLLCLKYKHRFPPLLICKGSSNFNLFAELYKFNFWKTFSKNRKTKRLQKSVFLIEHQRWFIKEGFVSGRILFGKVTRSANFFGC